MLWRSGLSARLGYEVSLYYDDKALEMLRSLNILDLLFNVLKEIRVDWLADQGSIPLPIRSFNNSRG